MCPRLPFLFVCRLLRRAKAKIVMQFLAYTSGAVSAHADNIQATVTRLSLPEVGSQFGPLPAIAQSEQLVNPWGEYEFQLAPGFRKHPL